MGIDAGGDAHISQPEAGGEGMQGLILATALPIVAHLGDDLHAEVPLLLLVVGEVQERVVHLRAAGDLADQLHLLRAQGIEDGLHIGGLQAGLEDIHQGVVNVVVRGEQGGIAARQVEHSFKVGLERGRNYSRRGPCAQASWAAVVTIGKFLHPFGRHLDLLIVVAPGDLDQAGIEGRRGRAGKRRAAGRPAACRSRRRRTWCGRSAAGWRAGAPVLRTAGGHVGLLVPAQQGGGMVEVEDFGQPGFEFLELLFRWHRSPLIVDGVVLSMAGDRQ